jgi:hypothetical protein
MSTDAFLTVLGPGRVRRWTLDGDGEYLAARNRELRLLESIEAVLSRQLARELRLGPPLIPERAAEPAAMDVEHAELSWTVGGSEGLASIQASVLVAETGNEPCPFWCMDEPHAPRHQARAFGFRGRLGAFRHLLDHDPCTGIYLPLDFPEPFETVCGEEKMTVGSLNRLIGEINLWRQTVLPRLDDIGKPPPDWIRFHMASLKEGADIALEQGLALELF